MNIKNLIVKTDIDFRIRTLIFLFLMMILCVKFSFYFTGEALTGWDTIGHYHMAKIYSDFFSDFSSTGYDYNWFQGFPAFYFYPQFFYFISSNIDLLFHDMHLSFNLSILLVIVFFSICYLKFAFLVFKDSSDKYFSYIFALSGLFFYLSYPGSGTQGLSIIGIINGTFVSTLGHGLILLCLYYVEKFRENKNMPDFFKLTVLSSLMFYTHFLSSVFYCILIFFYFCYFRKEFDIFAIASFVVLTSVLSFPILFNFFKYSAFSDSIAISNYYPGILSILGYDYFDIASDPKRTILEIILPLIGNFKFINIIFIILFFSGIFFIFNGAVKSRYFKFIAFSSLFFFLLSIDTSFVFIFNSFKIHWYRSFDIFFIFFTIIVFASFEHMLSLIPDKKYNYLIAGGFLILIQLGFYLWNPLSSDNYKSLIFNDYSEGNGEYVMLNHFLAGIEKNSLILPEYVRTSGFYGSPHWPDYPIQNNGHRNALGLMIESSLTPKLTHAYIPSENTDMFVWGVDTLWKNLLYNDAYPDENLRYLSFVGYIEESGINYILTQSEKFREFLRKFDDNFEEIRISGRISAFKVKHPAASVNIISSKPYGFIDFDLIYNGKNDSEELYKNFLLYSNQSRILIKNKTPVINITPFFNDDGFKKQLRDLVSVLVIYNSSDKAVNDYMVQKIIDTDIPIILVNFKKTGYMKGNAVYLYTAYHEKPNADISDADTAGIRETERIRFIDNEIIKNKIVLNNIPIKDNTGHTIVEINFSYFPDWKTRNNSRIFQTDTNHMILYADEKNIELQFSSSLARIITIMLYLLSAAFIFTVIISHTPIYSQNYAP